ncbi:cyanase [bacterium]|nr:MAG: cyanase [bacterium]
MSDIQPITKQLLAAKRAKKMTFADLEPILGLDEVIIAAIFYRQATPSMEQACTLLETLDLPLDLADELSTYPSKGLGPVVPTDPLIYRFYEIIQVYGYPLKDVIQEKFGEGIMSAIDFTMHVDKQEDPKGDRVLLTLNGKFLPYKKW